MKMFKNKSLIDRLIKEEIEKYFILEQSGTVEKEDSLDLSSNNPTPSAAENGLDAGVDVGGDLDLGNMDTDDNGGLPDNGTGGLDAGESGDEGVDGTDDDFSAGGGLSGGGLSGGSGGGGFDFGSGGETGMEPDGPEEEDLVSTIGPEDVEIPSDPILSITNDAIKLLNQTKAPNKILKNVKSSIQKYFDNFEDATPIIKSLWDTEDLVLRDVARRLLTFLKGI